MTDPDHITSPDLNRSPYAHSSDVDLIAADQRMDGEADESLVAELERRGLDF